MTGQGCPLKKLRSQQPEALWATGTSVQTLALALMAGGMLALGAFTAPAVFGHFARPEAGPVMAGIFRRFDMLLLGALVAVWIGESLRMAAAGFRIQGLLAKIRLGLLLALTGGLLYSALVLNADIARMNQAGMHRDWSESGRRFEQVHKSSEAFYKADMLAAALLILLTPFAGRRIGTSHD